MDTVKRIILNIAGFVLCFYFDAWFDHQILNPILATILGFKKLIGKYFWILFIFKYRLYDIITPPPPPNFHNVHYLGTLIKNKKENNIKNYVKFIVSLGPLFYDVYYRSFLLGQFYGQSFMSALVGQIPFAFNAFSREC